MLPSFVSNKLPPTKALAVQTAIIGGGAGFSLCFPKPESFDASFHIILGSHRGHFLRPEGFYYPSSVERMPLGWKRYEAFLSFQTELNAFLFPYLCKTFPLCESLGAKAFLSSVLPYSEKYESRKARISLPQRKTAEDGA